MEKVPFTAISNYVFDNKALTFFEKALYGKISSLAEKNGYCYAGNKYIADRLGISVRHVSRCIAKLNDLGFIKVNIDRARGNIRNIYVGTKTTVTLSATEFSPQKLSTPMDTYDNTPMDTDVKNNTMTLTDCLITENMNTPSALARELRERSRALAALIVDKFQWAVTAGYFLALGKHNPVPRVLHVLTGLLDTGKDIRLKGRTVSFEQFVTACERLTDTRFNNLLYGFFELRDGSPVKDKDGKFVLKDIRSVPAYVVATVLKLTKVEL